MGAIGFEGRIDYGAIGNVTNLANRLCDIAGPGDILAAQRVHADVEELVYSEDLGEVAILGLQRPARAFKLLDYRDAER